MRARPAVVVGVVLVAVVSGGLVIVPRSLRVDAGLRDTNPAAFHAMMQAILDGRPFAEAVETGYRTDVETLWLRFVRTTGVSTVMGR